LFYNLLSNAAMQCIGQTISEVTELSMWPGVDPRQLRYSDASWCSRRRTSRVMSLQRGVASCCQATALGRLLVRPQSTVPTVSWVLVWRARDRHRLTVNAVERATCWYNSQPLHIRSHRTISNKSSNRYECTVDQEL